MFCNINIFATSCNYTLKVCFKNCIPSMWSRPVAGGNSAEGWRGVRPGVADPGLAPRSRLSEGRHRGWLERLRRDFPFNSSPRSFPRVTCATPGPSNGPSNGRTPPSGVSGKALRRVGARPRSGARFELVRSGRCVELSEDPRAVQV